MRVLAYANLFDVRSECSLPSKLVPDQARGRVLASTPLCTLTTYADAYRMSWSVFASASVIHLPSFMETWCSSGVEHLCLATLGFT